MPGPPDPPEDPQAIIFQVVDPEGREVGLNEGAWYHSRWERGHGMSQDHLRDVIVDPDRIVWNDDNESFNYAKWAPERRFFRLVCAKDWPDRNPRYQVSTAYSRSTPPRGQVVWQKPVKP